MSFIPITPARAASIEVVVVEEESRGSPSSQSDLMAIPTSDSPTAHHNGRVFSPTPVHTPPFHTPPAPTATPFNSPAKVEGNGLSIAFEAKAPVPPTTTTSGEDGSTLKKDV